MTEKTMAELRAETDRLMHSPLHMHHEARIAALAAERNAADVEIERLTRELDEARADVEMLRATRELDEALAEAERLLAVQVLYEALAECVDRIDTFYGPPGSNRIDRELIARARSAMAKARYGFERWVCDE